VFISVLPCLISSALCVSMSCVMCCRAEDWIKERLEKALYCISRALEYKSTYADNPYIWETKDHRLFFLERYEEALKSYDKAQEIDPDYYSAEIGRRG
jgi:tetratricopeptide (TPR) repeat protein